MPVELLRVFAVQCIQGYACICSANDSSFDLPAFQIFVLPRMGKASLSACCKPAPNTFLPPSKACLHPEPSGTLAAGRSELWKCLCRSSSDLSHPYLTVYLA